MLAKVNTQPYGLAMVDKKPRLGPQDWINAGFRTLTQNGPEALRVEPIARGLGTTKGSFYWHFKDLAALQLAMLAYWEDAATHRVIADLEQLPPGQSRLQALSQAVNAPHDAQGGPGAEAAIRGWARAFAPANAALARVDAARLAFLQDCLSAVGNDDPDMPFLIYAAHLGLEQLSVNNTVDGQGILSRLIAMASAQPNLE